jgi:hypothetical protein
MRDPISAALTGDLHPDYDTDDKLNSAGYATGADVLTEMFDVYAEHLGDTPAAHAQLRSLINAIRSAPTQPEPDPQDMITDPERHRPTPQEQTDAINQLTGSNTAPPPTPHPTEHIRSLAHVSAYIFDLIDPDVDNIARANSLDHVLTLNPRYTIETLAMLVRENHKALGDAAGVDYARLSLTNLRRITANLATRNTPQP